MDQPRAPPRLPRNDRQGLYRVLRTMLRDALAATLALTGLHFCHATALRWEDFEEERAILRIERRQLRGRVGPVTGLRR